jgi:hypothetical protein
MTKLGLTALTVALVLLFFGTRAVFGGRVHHAPNPAERAQYDNNLRVGAQVILSLDVKLPDGSSVIIPIDLQMMTHIQNSAASMDVVATVGEGTGATTVPILGIPTIIESIHEPPASTVVADGATAARNANLRQGPGTDFAIVGNVRPGDALQVIGQNSDGSWLQLSNGTWIASFLVAGLSGSIQPPPITPTIVFAASPTALPPAIQAPLPTNTPVPIPPTPVLAATPGSCEPSYPTICIPVGVTDLNCDDVPYDNFTVLPPDPHGFDGNDNDGIGCEN